MAPVNSGTNVIGWESQRFCDGGVEFAFYVVLKLFNYFVVKISRKRDSSLGYDNVRKVEKTEHSGLAIKMKLATISVLSIHPIKPPRRKSTL